jgi:hypothetical protein
MKACFELKIGVVNMIQASSFCGKASEDANAHLHNFLEVSITINPKGTTMDNIRLCLFLFSLLGKAKIWFYTKKDAFNNWHACSNAFLAKYFPVGKTNAFRIGFPIFDNSRMRQSRKPGNVSKNTLQHAHTTSWKNG